MDKKCKKCGEVFPATTEHFVMIKNKKAGWEGLATECRVCRNLRFRPYYEKNRARLIAKATESARVVRATKVRKEIVLGLVKRNARCSVIP